MSALIRLRLEPRKAIMARAEVVWEDQPGAWRGAMAKIEDTSHSGACIRMSVPISVGAKIKVKWQREEFIGIAKYCRRDEGDYVLGIQRETPGTKSITQMQSSDAVNDPAVRSSGNIENTPPQQDQNARRLPEHVPAPAPASTAAKNIAATLAVEPPAKVQNAPAQHEKKSQELPKPAPRPALASVATGPTASPVALEPLAKAQNARGPQDKNAQGSLAPHVVAAPAPMPPKAVALPVEAALKEAKENAATSKTVSVSDASPTNAQQPDTNLRNEPLAQEPSQGQERTIVINKLLHLGSARQKQAAAAGNTSDTKAPVTTTEPKPPRAGQTTMSAKVTGLPPNQGSLLSLQDIYLAVGISSPRLGYNIDTVSGMLDSDHLRGMTSEVKRASVLMALEAAGTSINELLQDGAKRLDALNNYEAAERKRFEDYEARKSQESAQIQSEIERMTAHCLERIKHNLSEVTLAKDAFLNWQTTKQKEAQRISEAVALFSKSPAAEAPGNAKPELQTAGAESKH